MFWKKKKIIVTHNSKFHADDIFAVATLILMLEKEESEYEVIRSRDPEVISRADYVVDVGEVYSEKENRFDHHQKGGAGKRDNRIPYASFGLVWKRYGEVVSGNIKNSQKIDQILVQQVDAHDNGLILFETKIPGVYPYTIESLRYAFVPTWKEGFKDINLIFASLVTGAQSLLRREITRASDFFEAEEAIKKIYNDSQNKQLIIMDRYYPANDFLIQYPEPLFMVFPSSDDGTWILNTIQNDENIHSDRKSLPQSWAGKSGEDLKSITGVSDVVFCHNNRFLAVAKTKESILKLAEIAMNS